MGSASSQIPRALRLSKKGLLRVSGAQGSATGAETSSDVAYCYSGVHESRLPEVGPSTTRTCAFGRDRTASRHVVRTVLNVNVVQIPFWTSEFKLTLPAIEAVAERSVHQTPVVVTTCSQI